MKSLNLSTRRRLLASLALTAVSAGLPAAAQTPAAEAQTQQAPDPAVTTPGPDTTPGTAPNPESTNPTAPQVSPPAEADDPLTQALLGGKVDFNLRLRYEFAEVGTLDTANAFTTRTRIGYTTDRFDGFQAAVQLESNLALNDDGYNAAGLNGQPNKSIIADPEDGEVNQIWLDYDFNHLGADAPDASVRVGRQRIILDDARFVGNVGWRQLEQTYDAVGLTAKPADNLEVYYAYLWGVNRIFGNSSGRDFQSDSHLFNATLADTPIGAITGFAYLLDFDNAAALSSQTYGGRLAGELGLNEDFKAAYAASAAWQQDYGDNPSDYGAGYFMLEAKAVHREGWFVGLGYEELGSDDGVSSFQTPLATGHAFNGFADAFLVTPAAGLRDYYVMAGVNLPSPFKGKFSATYHQFTEAETSTDLGWEIDAVASHKFSPNLTGLVKYAHFEGDAGLADVDRVWVQLELAF